MSYEHRRQDSDWSVIRSNEYMKSSSIGSKAMFRLCVMDEKKLGGLGLLRCLCIEWTSVVFVAWLLRSVSLVFRRGVFA